jgi:hypothetical protein
LPADRWLAIRLTCSLRAGVRKRTNIVVAPSSSARGVQQMRATTARPIAILPAVRPRGRARDALAKPASSLGAAPPSRAPAAAARRGPRTVVPRARMCAADHSTPNQPLT